MRQMSSQQESKGTKWRRWRAGFVGGIALMACREIINPIKQRSRLLQCHLTARVTKPTKTGTPVGGGGSGPTTNCTPSSRRLPHPVSTQLRFQRADDEVGNTAMFWVHDVL